MHVADLMNRELIQVRPQDSVDHAVSLLSRRGVRHLLVVEKGKLVGIISDRDMKRALDPRRAGNKLMAIGGLYFLLEPIWVEEIMTRDPVTIGPDASAGHAGFIMVQRRFGALPVVENGRPTGIVTETDLLGYFAGASLDRDEVRDARKGGRKGKRKSNGRRPRRESRRVEMTKT